MLARARLLRPSALGRVRLQSSTIAATVPPLSSSSSGTAASASSGVRRWLTNTQVRLPVVGNVSISEVFGHSAFALAGTAFLDADVLNLRILSVASGAATLVFTYFHPVGKPLWLPFMWNALFMAINSGHIYNIVTEKREAERLPTQALELWRTVLAHRGVTAVDFARLLSAGTWTTLRKGATLQQEGAPSASVFLIVSGGADVKIGAKKYHRLHEHQFIGDFGLSSGIYIPFPVRGVATVTTNQQSTCLVWSRQQLAELLEGQPALAAAFQGAIAADVMRKLHQAEEHGGDTDDEQHRLARQSLWRARYSSVLSAVLSAGEVTAHQRQQLYEFRGSFHLDEEEHAALVLGNGWTIEEYEAGSNSNVLASRRAEEAEERAIERDRSIMEACAQGPAVSSDELARTVSGQGEPGPVVVDSLARRHSTARPNAKNRRFESSWISGSWAPAVAQPLIIWDPRKDAVIAVQDRLNVFFGTKALVVDGNYGPLTQQAVELFQIKLGLFVDGRVGPMTWKALRQAHLRRLEEDSLLTLVRGYDDKVDLDVVMLQQKLQLVVGEDCVKVDGIYGPRTTKAVALFMRQQGLAPPPAAASAADGESSGDTSETEGGKQMTPQAHALLQSAFLSELEAKSLHAASTNSVSGDQPAVDEEVRLLQLALNVVMGKQVVTTDGVWGPRTRKAVEDFQRFYGLPLEGDVAAQLNTINTILKAAPNEAKAESRGGARETK